MDAVGQTARIGDAPYWASGIYGERGRFASDSSNAVRINAVGRATAAAAENLLDQNQFAATNTNITTSCNRITDSIVNGEFRTSDRLRDIENKQSDCCCEIQKEIIRMKGDLSLENCQNTARLEAKIIEENSKTREQIRGDALLDAKAELSSLKTQIACGCHCPA